MYFLCNLHPLFHLKVPEILFSNSRHFPHTNDPFLQETSSKLAERRSSADVEGHVELHLVSQGSSCRCLSRGGDVRRHRGLGPYLVLLTEMLWSDMIVYVVVFQFPCDSSCRINILLFFFHPHTFYFFLFKHKNLKIKRIWIEIFKI